MVYTLEAIRVAKEIEEGDVGRRADTNGAVSFNWNNENNDIVLEWTDFLSLYQQRPSEISTIITDEESFIIGKPIGTSIDYKKTLEELVSFLDSKGIDFKSKINSNEEDIEIVIKSNLNEILALPWELLLSDYIERNDIIVYREVLCEKSLQEIYYENMGIFFAIAHSFKGKDGYKKKSDIHQDIYDETAGIIKKIIFTDSAVTKIDHVHVVKHLTKESFKNNDFSKFNVLHFMLHGEERGGVNLEDQLKHSNMEFLSKSGFMEIIAKKNPYKLIILSFCYSGQEFDSKSSLAFELIKGSISKHAISYMGSANSKEVITFSDNFYENMLTDKKNDIRDAFKNTMRKLAIREKFYPVLYYN